MKKYILVVDDEEAMRQALRYELERLGYEVGEAANGLEGLKSIEVRQPDLMILDIVMAPLSGWELLELVKQREETRGIPVLLLTAMGGTSAEAHGWHLGCDWYQVKEKPAIFEDLGLVVERLLAMAPDEADGEHGQLPDPSMESVNPNGPR